MNNELSIELVASITDFETKMGVAQKVLKDFEKQLSEVYSNIASGDMTVSQGEEISSQIRANIEEINGAMEETKVKMRETEEGSKGINLNFKNAIKSVKKLALGLLGVRSTYLAIRKIAGENEKLTHATQALWAGLGALFSGLFEGIGNALLKVIAYVDYIVQKLFGFSFMEKAMANTAKSAKATQNALSGFDELNNIGQTSSAGTGNWATDYQAIVDSIDFSSFEFLFDILERIKNVAIVIASIVAVIATVVALISTAIGATSVATTAWTIAIGALVVLVILNLKNIANIFVGLVQMLSGALWVAITGSINIVVGAIALAVSTVGGVLNGLWNFITSMITTVGQTFSAIIQGVVGFFKSLVTGDIAGAFSSLWSGIKNGVGTLFSGIWSSLGSLLTGFKNGFSGVWSWFDEKLITPIRGVISTFYNNLIKPGLQRVLNGFGGIVNGFVRGVNSVIGTINKIPGVSIPYLYTWSVPQLATGTNYVPNDQLAYIHKGEAVVPKKFNDKEYFGAGNEETNALLETLIEAVNNIDINPTVAVKDIVNGINNRSKKLGVSVL